MTMLEQAAMQHGPTTYEPKLARITDIQQLTDFEKRFRLEFVDKTPLGHDPGQFVQLSIMGVGEAPISICSSPTRPDYFDLCIRRAGEVTGFVHNLKAGDTVGIRGPLGRGFDVSEFAGKDILIVAGGLGLAPVRSLIQYILDERARFGEFNLLYGARAPSELLFRDDLHRWKESDDVSFRMTVDKPDEGWRGRVGVVTTLFEDLPKLSENTMAVIVGPPVMFKFVVLEVLSRRITQKNVLCSLERRMKCGIGKCGHCQANDVYVCLEGPVFRYGELKALREAIE